MTTVLLVDDEKLVREELGGILEDEGYTVYTAKDGEQGLLAYREFLPDLVITDAKMPRREGLSLAREIFAENPHVPITMITGHGNETMAIEALRLGITDFIKKPVQLADLLTALERMEGALQLTRNRSAASESLPDSSRLLSRSRTYEVKNDVESIPAFVSVVLAEFAADIDTRRRDSLELALREIMINAVEHGNLSVTYEEKTEETEQGTFDKLIAERSTLTNFRERVVRVETTRTDETLTIIVEDEGDGFDWKSLPDPTDPANLLLSHGRGVLIAHLSVDALHYNDKGNKATIVIKLEGRGAA